MNVLMKSIENKKRLRVSMVNIKFHLLFLVVYATVAYDSTFF